MTTNNPVTDRAREAAAVGDYVLVPRKLPRETKDAILAYMERHCPNRAKETAWDAVSAFHEVVLAATPASDSPAIPNDRAKEIYAVAEAMGPVPEGIDAFGERLIAAMHIVDSKPTPASHTAPDALRSVAERAFKHGHQEGWTGNQCRRDVQHVDAEKGWSLYVSNGALEKTIATLATPASDCPAMSDDEKADALWGCNDAKLKQVASDSPAIPETWRCPNCHVRFSRIDDVDAHLASLPTPASHTAPDAQTVERMARAIHLYDATTGGDPTWEELGENGQEDCRDRARSYLAALATPAPSRDEVERDDD